MTSSSPTMKLSTAIREGARLRPQGFNSYFYSTHHNGMTCSCALGAAYEASVRGVDHDPIIVDRFLRHTYPELDTPLSELIPDALNSVFVINAIADMNDIDRLSREAIADVVEGWGY